MSVQHRLFRSNTHYQVWGYNPLFFDFRKGYFVPFSFCRGLLAFFFVEDGVCFSDSSVMFLPPFKHGYFIITILV